WPPFVPHPLVVLVARTPRHQIAGLAMPGIRLQRLGELSARGARGPPIAALYYDDDSAMAPSQSGLIAADEPRSLSRWFSRGPPTPAPPPPRISMRAARRRLRG